VPNPIFWSKRQLNYAGYFFPPGILLMLDRGLSVYEGAKHVAG
jgi:hypothetical protein